MRDLLSWSLEKARRQTLTLVEDLPGEAICRQAGAGENHPAWILGHLLLGDVYLLSLLGAGALSEDFPQLLEKYGPRSVPVSLIENYDPKSVLVERLTETGNLRVGAVRGMSDADFERPTPDALLARTQPTLGHHLQMLIFHEGHHGGQLSVWRKFQGFASVKGAFAP